MISTGTLVFMILDMLLGFAVPVCLAWWMIKKYKVRLSTILIGAATFIVFALVLEALVHKIVLGGSLGATIQGKTLYYALYGGLMAGLFEETGRFLSMKFLMKKEPTTVLPGLAYGAGHGGVEMLIVFGVSMISNLVMSVMINAGQLETIVSQTPAEAQEQVRAAAAKLAELRAGGLLLGLWERISALILHFSLSVLVWAAVRKGGKWLWLFPAAILLHAGVDAQAVILSKSASMPALEAIIFAESIAIAGIAYMVGRRISS
jgi:uncharacterized membrane protein YhfC